MPPAPLALLLHNHTSSITSASPSSPQRVAWFVHIPKVHTLSLIAHDHDAFALRPVPCTALPCVMLANNVCASSARDHVQTGGSSVAALLKAPSCGLAKDCAASTGPDGALIIAPYSLGLVSLDEWNHSYCMDNKAPASQRLVTWAQEVLVAQPRATAAPNKPSLADVRDACRASTATPPLTGIASLGVMTWRPFEPRTLCVACRCLDNLHWPSRLNHAIGAHVVISMVMRRLSTALC